jgi:hypothetical protein
MAIKSSAWCKYFASHSLCLLTLMNPSHLIPPMRLSRDRKSLVSWNSPSARKSGIFKVIRMTLSRKITSAFCHRYVHALGLLLFCSQQSSCANSLKLVCRRTSWPRFSLNYVHLFDQLLRVPLPHLLSPLPSTRLHCHTRLHLRTIRLLYPLVPHYILSIHRHAPRLIPILHSNSRLQTHLGQPL